MTVAIADPFPGDDLQLDLLSVIARIRQLREEGWFESSHFIWHRIETCDLPRLEGHLTPEVAKWAERVDELLTGLRPRE